MPEQNSMSLAFSTPMKSFPRGNEPAAITPGLDISPVQDIADRDHRRFSTVDERDFADHHRRNVYVGLHMSMNGLDETPGSGDGSGRHHHHHHRRHHSRSHHRGERSHHHNGHHHHHHHHKHRHRSDGSAAPLTPSFNSDGKPVQGPGDRVRTLLAEDLTVNGHEIETHELFTELEELQVEDGVMEWKETARWVKYEEDVEWGGQKWSKPHVAALSLHSLFELRSCILQGTVLLNMNASDLTAIADLVLDDLVATTQLEEANRHLVRTALLCRHTHQNQSSQRPKLLRRNTSEDGHRKTSSVPTAAAVDGLLAPDHSQLRENSLPDGSSPSTVRKPAPAESHFMKKLPPNSEASNVLVGQVDFLTRPLIAFVRLAESVVLGDLTEVPLPTRFLFILLGPKGEEERYHEIGRSISTLMSDPIFHNVAYRATCRADLLAGVDEFLDQVVVLPPGEWDPTIRLAPPASPRKAAERLMANARAPAPSREKRQKGHGGNGGSNNCAEGEDEDPGKDLHHAGLKRTRRCFGGLVGDIKRRWPWYFWSDFTDAVHVQTIPAIIFIYFACIAPTVTFGGLLEDSTNGYMGTMEMIVASCFCGVCYSLFSGQPLTILGATGPMLVFEGIVFSFSESNGLPFLQFRFWIGMWTAAYLLIMVAIDASALISFFTRFTEETFSALISLIFIYEAFSKLYQLEGKYPPHGEYHLRSTVLEYNCSCASNDTVYGQMPSDLTWSTCTNVYNATAVGRGCPPESITGSVYFVSFIELFGTFFIVYFLKKLRNSPYFPTWVRGLISDFAVVIAIICMLVFDIVFSVPTPKLNVPENFEPTRSADRGWVISPIKGVDWWLPLAASIPAILACILVFMDQQITALLVNRREHKLKKGPGYHLDLLVVAVLLALCSLFGLPWLVAATVRSVTHVGSLSVMDTNTAPGEKPKFLGVREQRVTNFCVFLLHGLSVLAAPALRQLPLPILYGLFLFMGYASLRGVQFVERLQLLFMPQKFQFDMYYVRHVPMYRMHAFTLIQLLSLVALCIIKLTPASLIFPIAVLGLVVVRHFLKYIFTDQELEILDDKMPELLKRKKQDAKKHGVPPAPSDSDCSEVLDAEQIIPLSLGSSESTGVRQRTNNMAAKSFNMTDELNRCELWQHTHSHTTQRLSSIDSQYEPSSQPDGAVGKVQNGYVPLPMVRESAL
ncbi:electrogenic sodium bicarbonate cotransporter 1-like isoform X1 [Sycon ciliatum]|uniref:electrogenic sodium bicarbonate cotransporter 1-like isoform X1 n=2 Tax=Sycon ciliatum TaxID=27933 RepID=UPI0031F62023